MVVYIFIEDKYSNKEATVMSEQQALMKSYLDDIRLLNARIEAKQHRVEELEERAVYTKAQYGGITQSHGYDNARENLLVKLCDEKEELLSEIATAEERKRDTLEMLECIKDAKCYSVMTKRYLENKRWEDIADDLEITFQHAHVLHRKGLQIICDNYEAQLATA